MNKKIFIYSITCPTDGLIKYIGKTVNPKMRFRKHRSQKLKSAGSKWILSLIERGLEPIFDIIAEATEENWEEAERYYIKLYRSMGEPLFNHTIGGEGGSTMLGRKLTPEQTQKIIDFKTGRPNPATSKYNVINKGYKVNQYTIEGDFVASHNSMRQAGRAVNRSSANIQRMISGNTNIRQVGGFVFKRVAS